ncbi:MAG: NAD(P)-dependent oxidoreductase [Pedobacter sp.]|nr:NAD(P)-dependent oxidoreductase [Pedobacter sp.]
MSKIGFAGIGLMGLPMCRRLLAAGHTLSIWNRSAEKCAALQAEGATVAATPKAIAEHCDILMLCVSDTAAVQELLQREDGLLAGLAAGKVIVDFSSISPAATRELAAAVTSKGAHWVDAPVSGGVVGAEAGSLVIMAGGDATIIDGLRPVLAAVSQRVTHMGPNGAGQVSKICNQLIVAANSVLIAEAVALAEKSGVDAGKLAPALAGGFADSKPFQLLVPRMSARQFEPVQWRVKTLLKDLDMAVTLSQEAKASVPLAAHAAELMREHGANGALEKDLSSLITHFAGSEKPC